jgi:hypothetical protein
MDLVTTGTLDVPVPVKRPTLVADQITAYLEQAHKTLDQAVLTSMMTAVERSITRQLMQPRMDRTGYESTTTYSGPCARKARLAFDGVPGEPLQARTHLKFLLGDLVELAVIGIAQLAGVDVSDNNRDLSITGLDGVKVHVHPDGRVRVVEGEGLTHWYGHYNFECKSCDSRTFDAWLANGGPNDDWGYLTQCSIEIAAWREAGYDVNETVFLAVSTGSRQGSVAEWLIPYDQALVDGWHARRALARGTVMPPVPYQAVPEMTFAKGKALDAGAFTHGEPVPRVDKNGKTHGWDVPTGRNLIPLACGYCAYKQTCWPGAEMDMVSGKPVWVVQMT